MRTKVRELRCRDDAGTDAVVIEWRIQPPGVHTKKACCSEYTLADGSPVTPLGGKYEHFYSGKLFTPV